MKLSGLFLLIGALVAGAAIGYVAGNAGGEPAADTGIGGGAAPHQPAERIVVREPAPLPSAGGGGGGDLEEYFASLELDPEEVTTGDGKITGTVRDEDGRPMEEVLVRATRLPKYKRQTRDTSGAVPEDKSLEEAVRQVLLLKRLEETTRRDATTDEAGHFEITGLANDADYRLAAWKEGWQITPAPGARPYRLKAGSTSDFLARPVVAVKVTVTKPDGTEPKDATIYARLGSSGGRSETWKPDHRTIHLAPGDYMLRAYAGEKSELKSPEQEITIEKGQAALELTFVLEERPGVKGKLIAKKVPAGYIQVAAVKVVNAEDENPDRLIGAPKTTWVQPGANQEFVLTDLSEGTWLIGAVLSNQKVLVHKTVEITNGVLETDLVLPELSDEESVLVVVEGPDGKILRDARVSAGYSVPGRPSWPYGQGTQEEDGSWRVPHTLPPGQEEVEGGTYFLQAWSRKYGQKRQDYSKGDGRVVIRFDEPGKLVVTLTGYKGSEYEGAVFLNLTPKDQVKGVPGYPVGGLGGQFNADDGTQTFAPVAPGEYVLKLNLRGRQWRQVNVYEEDILVKAGENRITIPLPTLYRLTILVPEAEGTRNYVIEVQGKQVNRWAQPVPRKEPGKVIFDRIPAGTYVFTVTGGRVAEKMVVTVPGAETVRFTPQVFNAMRVTVDRADGYLARTGFKSGDLVVAVDGAEFEDETHMKARLLEGKQKESVALTVVRGAKRFTIRADLAKVEKPAEAGGRWEASTR